MTDPTPHADRDRTEPPPRAWWPPAAPAAYDTIERIVDEWHAEQGADLDEPVPFVLTDEPAGDLLPSAPEGILLRCTLCPHTLADTRGGNLVHEVDGSHTYVPPGEHSGTDGNRYGPDGYLCCRHCAEDVVHDVEKDGHDRPCQTCDDPGAMTRERLREAEAELERLRAVVTRVEALADETDKRARDLRAAGLGNAAAVHDTLAMDIRAALKGGA